MDEADGLGLLGADPHGGHGHPLAPRRADDAGEPAGAAAAGDGAELHLGDGELGVRACRSGSRRTWPSPPRRPGRCPGRRSRSASRWLRTRRRAGGGCGSCAGSSSPGCRCSVSGLPGRLPPPAARSNPAVKYLPLAVMTMQRRSSLSARAFAASQNVSVTWGLYGVQLLLAVDHDGDDPVVLGDRGVRLVAQSGSPLSNPTGSGQ